jgi:hypothetical protein
MSAGANVEPALVQEIDSAHERALFQLLHSSGPTPAAVCECLRYATLHNQFKWLKKQLPSLLSVDLTIRTLHRICEKGAVKNKGQLQQWCVLLMDYFAKSRAAVPDSDLDDASIEDSKEEEQDINEDDSEPFDRNIAPLSDPALIELCHSMNLTLHCGTWCRLISLFHVPYSAEQRVLFVRHLLQNSKFKDAVICAVRLHTTDYFSVRSARTHYNTIIIMSPSCSIFWCDSRSRVGDRPGG